MAKTTLEDWNTWEYLFGNLVSPFVISSDDEIGDYGGYEITDTTTSLITVVSKCDLDIKGTNTLYYFRVSSDNQFSRVGTGVIDNTFNLPYYENNKYIIPLKTDLSTYQYGAGAVIPYYSKYYLFSDDSGENRLYRLNTILQDNISINDYHDRVISKNNKKYCNFSTIVEDKYITYANSGVDLTDSFIDLYKPPLWTVIEPFYLGCKNLISDKITGNVDITTYINNKEQTEYIVPLDYTMDYLNVRLTSKSQSPYLPMDVATQIPVIVKEIDNVNDLGKYEYSKLADDFVDQREVTFESQINSRIDLNNHTIQGMDFNVEKELLIENGQLIGAKVINNGVLTVQNAWFSETTIINNGTLTLSASDIVYMNIVNNGKLIIKDCNILISNNDKDMPFIHNTGTYSIINNNIIANGEFDNNSLIFIRSENIDNILENNLFEYDITFDNYRITGNGFIYSNIDDDTIILKNLISEEIE